MYIQASNIFSKITTPQNNNCKQSKNVTCPNLAPLKQDTVSFSGGIPKSVDLLDLPADKIIKICKRALRDKIEIGQGQEAIAYKIEDYPYYCIRQVKKSNSKTKDLGLDMKLNKYDKVNHVVAHLNPDTQLMRYIPGIPLKIMRHSDTESGIKVKQALQELVANNFPESSFKNAIKQVEEAKEKGIDFDRFGENLLVDPISQNLTCIDFSPNYHMDEYNPISFLYHAIDADRTDHAPKILGKLASAYAQRLLEVPAKKLNLDTLDTNLYARGFEGDPFVYFPDKALLKETEAKLKELIAEKQNPTLHENGFEYMVEMFKEFVDEKLINYVKPREEFY